MKDTPINTNKHYTKMLLDTAKWYKSEGKDMNIIDCINGDVMKEMTEKYTDLMIYGVSISDQDGNRIDPVEFFEYQNNKTTDE